MGRFLAFLFIGLVAFALFFAQGATVEQPQGRAAFSAAVDQDGAGLATGAVIGDPIPSAARLEFLSHSEASLLANLDYEPRQREIRRVLKLPLVASASVRVFSRERIKGGTG